MKLGSKAKVVLIALGFITAIFATVMVTLSIAKSTDDNNAMDPAVDPLESIEQPVEVDLDDLLDAIESLDNDPVEEGFENPITETDHRNVVPAAGY